MEERVAVAAEEGAVVEVAAAAAVGVEKAEEGDGPGHADAHRDDQGPLVVRASRSVSVLGLPNNDNNG